jgi:carbonic anhydrase
MNLRKRVAALSIVLALAFGGAAHGEGMHWTYGTHAGPAEWGALSPEFTTCKLGKHQSPIDIRGAAPADLPPIKFDYKPSPLKVIDNGHSIQVNYPPGSSIDVGGVRYDLVQFHFHKPSEEKINGKSHPMVVHLVHKSADGKLAVVAVLLDSGGASALIDSIWKNIPKQKEKETIVQNATIDATDLLPSSRGYYTFQGSLTTPPCSEDVTWMVLKDPVKIADAEIAAFGKIYPMNARPTQPLNGRDIRASK